MGESAKNPNQTSPESYSPQKPEILNMVEEYARNYESTALPERYLISPKEKTADFNGEKWPFSNVLSAMLSAAGLLYGQTERYDNTGSLINDDVEYSIQNCLNAEAFGIFYSPDAAWMHSLGMEIYGLGCERFKNPEIPAAELIKLVRYHILDGNAVVIRKYDTAMAYVVFGYEDNGDALLCCEFEDGNDGRNCSYDFSKPIVLREWTEGITDLLLIRQNSRKISRSEAYKKALADGWRLMTLQSPDYDMDIGLLRGAGQPIYDEWIRQLEQANAENSEVFYNAAPVFPHFLALYENRLHLYKFLKIYTEICSDVNLHKAFGICEQLRDLTNGCAALSCGWLPQFKDWSNNERRSFLIEKLKECRALEVEIAGLIKMFIDAPESYSPKRPEILSMAENLENSYRSISEMKPFQNEFGIYRMPAARVIGKAFVHPPNGNAVPFVEETFHSPEWPKVLKLPTVLPDTDCGFTCEYVFETQCFTYIVSVLAPSETPVPEGCQYRDVAETLVAVGLRGEDAGKTCERLKAFGYTTNWDAPMCGWNAEIYFHEEDKVYPNENNPHWLVPCRLEEQT